MKKLAILQTPARFYPAVGGVEKYVLGLSKALVKEKNRVTVLCSNDPKSKVENFSGIHIKRLSYIGKVANTNITVALPFILFKQDFDVIHTHMPTPWSADFSALISFLKRKPLIITYHNDLLKNDWTDIIAKTYNNTLLKLVLNHSRKIIVTQENYIKDSLYLKKYSKKITVLPIGINLDEIKFKKLTRKNKQLFFLSVLDKHHRYKGLDYLIHAIKIVINKFPHVKLFIGGKGELLEEYKNLVKSLKLENNIIFLGYLTDDEISTFYQTSTIFILPSISYEEGFGIVLLEAMAYSTPVITTNIAGTSNDIKKYQAGLVIKPKDSAALAKSILSILQNQKLVKIMGEKGNRLVKEKYDWELLAKHIENIYHEVLN